MVKLKLSERLQRLRKLAFRLLSLAGLFLKLSGRCAFKCWHRGALRELRELLPPAPAGRQLERRLAVQLFPAAPPLSQGFKLFFKENRVSVCAAGPHRTAGKDWARRLDEAVADRWEALTDEERQTWTVRIPGQQVLHLRC